MDAFIEQSFQVKFTYRVHFTEHIFSKQNSLLAGIFQGERSGGAAKVLFVIDSGLLEYYPDLPGDIQAYFRVHAGVQLVEPFLILPGGETVKNNPEYVKTILQAIDHQGIDRHAFLVALGGGSVLDTAGWAAAIAHRGIRHIRIPTTVLSQNDSGVGVKNGINYFGKKNFLGSFAPPNAVINDSSFLQTLPQRQWIAGISEALKVALIKDAEFFSWIKAHAAALKKRHAGDMQQLIRQCAALHLEHIRSGDPFEMGSSRPLDFGHWSAHKLEQMSGFELLHGEAVSLGIALDCVYSWLSGMLSKQELQRILNVFTALGLPLTHPLLQAESPHAPLLEGKREFQEHLGGRLTVMLLREIGQGEEVHRLDDNRIGEATRFLRQYKAEEKELSQ